MGMLRTFTLALAVGQALALPPAPLRAQDDLARLFAVCTGRLSAAMEHAWLMGGPEAEAAGQQRAAMLSLLEAVADPHDKRLMALRVDAKAAQSALMSRAIFAQDKVAAVRSAQLLQGCTDLIGSS